LIPGDDTPIPLPDPVPEVPAPAPAAEEEPEVQVEAADPENRDAIIQSIVELEERAWRRLEEEAALPPLPPPPTKRWSVALPLAFLAVIVWVAPLMSKVPIQIVTSISARAETYRIERLLHTAAQVVQRYRIVRGHYPRALTDAGPFPAQIHYYPDTGGRFLLEMPTSRGIARITVDRGEMTFHLYGPTELRPAPPPPPPVRPRQ
jgi:hypothetical protein